MPATGFIIAVGRNGRPLPIKEAVLPAEAPPAKYKLHYDLRVILRIRKDAWKNPRAGVPIDDFAPVNLCENIKRSNKKRR